MLLMALTFVAAAGKTKQIFLRNDNIDPSTI